MSKVFKSFQVTLGVPYTISQSPIPKSSRPIEVEADDELRIKREALKAAYRDECKAMLEDAAKKSEEIINDAKEKAKQILMEAEKQSKEISEKLFQEAKAQG